MIEFATGDIGHIIQLAIAPVFLLAGVGTNLMVLTSRLARIIDRSRSLEDRYSHLEDIERQMADVELDTLYRRAHLINRAITLITSSALLVCTVIASLFLGDALRLELGTMIAALFVLAMFSLIASFIFFLAEIFVATRTMSFRHINARKRRRPEML